MSSKTEQKTEIPEPTQQEKALMEMMIGALLPASLAEQGYDVTETRTSYEDTQEYRSFQERKNAIIQERAALGDNSPPTTSTGSGITKNGMGIGGRFGRDGGNDNARRIADANRRLEELNREESEFIQNYEPEIRYTTRKKLSPEIENLRSRLVAEHGNVSDEELRSLSPEYATMVDDYHENIADMGRRQDELTRTYMEKTQKFLDGDFAITQDQKNLIAENMAPTRAAVDRMFDAARAEAESSATGMRAEVGRSKDSMLSEVDRSEARMRGEISATEAASRREIGESDTRMRREVDSTTGSLLASTMRTFNEFETRVRETGMSMLEGLDVAGAQIRQTGMDMETALTNTISVHKELMKMGIEDYTGEVTRKVATTAAMIGRSSDDPEYTNEILGAVSRKVKEGELNLAAMEAQGKLAIKERTGAELEKMLMQKVGVAERTGGQLEQSTLAKGGQEAAILERGGTAKEQIAARTSQASEEAALRAGTARENVAAGTSQAREQIIGRTAQAYENVLGQLNATREELVRARGSADVGMEEQAANLRWQVGAGMAPQQIGLAQGIDAYNQAKQQQRIANASQAATSGMPFVNYMQQERMAEPTVTTRTNPGIGGIFSGILGAASAGASIYSGVSSAGAMGAIANRISGAAGAV